MKCKCEECHGRGYLTCEECGGRGEKNQSVADLKLDEAMPHYAELRELQQDAARCRRQEQELATLNPARAASYAQQLVGTLAVIDAQAERVIEGRQRGYVKVKL